MFRAAGEQQCAAGTCVALKNGKHRGLVFRSEVEEAVPGEDAVEAAAEGEGAHVGNDPLLSGKARAGDFEERGRGVDAGNAVSLGDQVSGNRQGRAAAKVEDGSMRPQQGEETVEPGLLKEAALGAQTVPGGGMALVEANDAFGIGGHGG